LVHWHTHDGLAAADKSLVLYLPFNEGNGDVTKDNSQYNHEAKLVNNPNWVDGKQGKALQFTGTNCVMIPIVKDLQLKENFSVEFWVKRDATQPATWNYMVAAGTLKWAVIFNTDGKVYIWSQSGAWAQRLVTIANLETDWTYIAALYSDNGMELYFNVKDKVGTGVKPPVVDDIDGSFMVGARNPGQEFFKGIIDEVAIYNRVLTLDEINRDMQAVGGVAVSAGGKLAFTWGAIKEF
jgi:hypothetical protein